MYTLMGGIVAGSLMAWGLQKYNRTRPASGSFPELVQWGAVPQDGVVWLKDGALMATWEYRGPDLDFVTVEQMDALARQFNRLLRTLGKNYMVHIDACRIPSYSYSSHDGFGSATGHFLDEVSRRKSKHGASFEGHYFLNLTYMPPPEVYRKVSKFFYTGSEDDQIDWETELHDFEERTRAIEDLMPQSIEFERLDTSEQFSYLNYLLKGVFQPVNAPPDPGLMSELFDQEFRPGFEPMLDHTFHRVVSVQGYPQEAFMTILRDLDDLAFPYRFSTRIIGTDPDDVRKMIKKRMERWFQKRQGGKDLLEGMMHGDDQPNEDLLDVFADDQAQDAREALKETRTGAIRYLNHTACVVVRHHDRDVALERAMRVQKVFSHKGFVTKVETANATEALLGTYPGHGHFNIRRVPVRSDYISRIVPLSSIYAGPKHNPSSLYPKKSPVLFHAETEESVPFRFCPYIGQVGHTVICGPTGTGKSILMGFQGYRHQQYDNAQTIMFDNGNSFALLCEAMNGKRFDVGDERVGFQPLKDIIDPNERRWAADWIQALAQLQGVQTTPTHQRVITETLEHMASRAEHNPAYLTMSELETQIQDRELKDALAPYSGAGAMGQMLNADEDSIDDARFQVFEMSSIIDLATALVTPVLLYVFHRIEKMLAADRPTYVGADEFFIFAAKSKAGRDYCMEALRTYRKMNAMMTIATQDASDLVPSSGEADKELATILNSCRTRIYLPNPDALEPSQQEAYKRHGLNEREIQDIADAIAQRDYIARQPTGTRRFNLGIDVELAFLTPLQGKDMVETAEVMRSMKAEHGDLWLHEWLMMRGYERHAQRALDDIHRRRAAADAGVQMASPMASGTDLVEKATAPERATSFE